MNTGLMARAAVTIAAPAADVWEALVKPAAIKTSVRQDNTFIGEARERAERNWA